MVWNVSEDGCAKTVLAGYYKYGVQTLLTGDFGTTGTVVVEIYEEDNTNKCDGGGPGPHSHGCILQEGSVQFSQGELYDSRESSEA